MGVTSTGNDLFIRMKSPATNLTNIAGFGFSDSLSKTKRKNNLIKTRIRFPVIPNWILLFLNTEHILSINTLGTLLSGLTGSLPLFIKTPPKHRLTMLLLQKFIPSGATMKFRQVLFISTSWWCWQNRKARTLIGLICFQNGRAVEGSKNGN